MVTVSLTNKTCFRVWIFSILTLQRLHLLGVFWYSAAPSAVRSIECCSQCLSGPTRTSLQHGRVVSVLTVSLFGR